MLEVEMRGKFFGRVQGVGMRAYICALAHQLNLKGSVQNLPDGSVEVVAQGPKSKLEEMVSQIKKRFMIEHAEIKFVDPERTFDRFKAL